MSIRKGVLQVLAALGTLVLALFVFVGTASAVQSNEIIQAVKNDVPNVGDNRVVIGELFARDG